MPTVRLLRRPAQPFLYLDGTGQSLGKPLTHTELGSADYAGDCKQSRSTLEPLGSAESSDPALPIRENFAYVVNTYNKLIKAGRIVRADGEVLPARPSAAADMQAVKAQTATAERSHPVWCMCNSETQHNYHPSCIEMPDNPSASQVERAYNKMIHFTEKDQQGPCCTFKTLDLLCRVNHCSTGIMLGHGFTPIDCPCCGYNPPERQWRADLSEFESMTPEQQKVRRKEHTEDGEEEYKWSRHYYGILFMYPFLHLDLIRYGADTLHLVYLNMFKHLWRYTIHESLSSI